MLDETDTGEDAHDAEASVADAVERSRLRYVTVWNRITNPDGSLCCWHPDNHPCPLLGHELVSLYEIVGDPAPPENNVPIHPEVTGG